MNKKPPKDSANYIILPVHMVETVAGTSAKVESFLSRVSNISNVRPKAMKLGVTHSAKARKPKDIDMKVILHAQGGAEASPTQG